MIRARRADAVGFVCLGLYVWGAVATALFTGGQTSGPLRDAALSVVMVPATLLALLWLGGPRRR